jgi:hypothetical protein
MIKVVVQFMGSILVVIIPCLTKLFSKKILYRAMAGYAGDNQIRTDEKRQQQPPLTDRLRQPDTDENQCAGQNPNQAVQQSVHAAIEPQIGKKLQNLCGRGILKRDSAGHEQFDTGKTAMKSLRGKFFLPLFAQGVMHLFTELHRHRIRLAIFVKSDGLAEVVHDHLAGIAPRHVLLELDADSRVNRAIHIFIQQRQ